MPSMAKARRDAAHRMKEKARCIKDVVGTFTGA
jgi:hypothetical protein